MNLLKIFCLYKVFQILWKNRSHKKKDDDMQKCKNNKKRKNYFDDTALSPEFSNPRYDFSSNVNSPYAYPQPYTNQTAENLQLKDSLPPPIPPYYQNYRPYPPDNKFAVYSPNPDLF